FFSSRRRHTRCLSDWSSDVCSSDLGVDDLQHARVDLLRAQIAFAAQRGSDAPTLLLKAARALEAVDPDLARTTYLEAIEAARFRSEERRVGKECRVRGRPDVGY